MGFLLSNYQLTICILYSLIFCLSSSAHLCHNDESTALLQFKQLFSFNCSACDCPGYSAPLNWKEGTDCCAWDGVTCDNTTAHVIGLDLFCNCLYGNIHPNSSLFNLVHLQHLDLTGNNFNHSQILPSFGRFTNLTHLHLYYSHLSGPIQSSEEEVWQGNNISNSIFHLQKLQELWLAGNRELTGLCDFPLSKKCKTPKVAEPPSLPSSSSHNYKCRLDGFGWEAVLMGYGCGAIFGLVIGSCIIQRKEEWLARIFRVKMRH